MGVPTVTVAGETHRSRMGASILTAAGLPDWIISSPQSIDAWLQGASGKLTAEPRLAALRSGLRERIKSSELFDADQLARLLEEAYREMLARVA
jgi:predicted O-linked N-acetylglucosamine transferase (SPINDLY family)